ncbi:MAG TPA: CDP-alcohol phosphatidyltransferase family protein, partial [Candidatus Nanoarchaeia archaeon]|nr:CDP-alcohol phosphatidyltransferase family protein [Candidatus Nanoarchaeia archaeon]
FSLVCGVLAVVFIERKFYFILLSVLSLVFDILDGNLARFIKKETEFGKWADHIADRSVEFLLIIAAPAALGLKLVTGVLFLAQQLLFLKTKTIFFGRALMMAFFAFGFFESGVIVAGVVYLSGLLWQLKKFLKG